MATQLITGISPYYECDAVVIYHGDCQRILPTLPSDSIDFVLTSRGERLWPERHRD